MHYLCSNSCHVMGCHIFLIKKHMHMFPQATTRDCKQYFGQLTSLEYHMGRELTAEGVAMQMAEPRYLLLVMTMKIKVCPGFKSHQGAMLCPEQDTSSSFLSTGLTQENVPTLETHGKSLKSGCIFSLFYAVVLLDSSN